MSRKTFGSDVKLDIAIIYLVDKSLFKMGDITNEIALNFGALKTRKKLINNRGYLTK